MLVASFSHTNCAHPVDKVVSHLVARDVSGAAYIKPASERSIAVSEGRLKGRGGEVRSIHFNM